MAGGMVSSHLIRQVDFLLALSMVNKLVFENIGLELHHLAKWMEERYQYYIMLHPTFTDRQPYPVMMKFPSHKITDHRTK